MWCTRCGAPMATTARTCAHCGRVRDDGSLTPLPREPAGAALGEPCEAGRHLGGMRIRDTQIVDLVAGRTLSGLETTGRRRIYELGGSRDVCAFLASVTWESGECEVRRTRRYETPWWQDRLLGRQRLAVEAWGDDWMQIELRQARLDRDRSLRLADVGEYELDAKSGACVRCALRLAGATAMGTRQEVLGVGDERRHVLCATFPRDAQLVPVVAFALTRVAPLLSTVQARSA